jgi:hypothetical protein
MKSLISNKNIMHAAKARTKRQEDEYDDSEMFAAVAYLLLPPAKCYFMLALVLVLGSGFRQSCSRDLRSLFISCRGLDLEGHFAAQTKSS